MNVLQAQLEKALAEAPHHLVTNLIAVKLRSQGIVLSDGEIAQLEDRVKEGKVDKFKIQSRASFSQEHVELSFTEEEINQIVNQYSAFLENGLPDLVVRV